MLRRRATDLAFRRENLHAALAQGAACEVDLRLTADGHFVCLHDRTLDRETTGDGRVGDASRAQIERLCQRDRDGAPTEATPLFLDEVADAVRAARVTAPALVQLDVKVPAQSLTPAVLERFGRMLGDAGSAFIASAYDCATVMRLVEVVPNLHFGFDPLRLYPRTFDLDADAFRDLAARVLATAPGATIYYLEAKLILAGLERGVNLVREVGRDGALVDAWTIDPDHPQLDEVLRRVIDAGCGEITTNDPKRLAPLVATIVRSRGADERAD
jgi:glycerophosphoryl diester phosphodiesterase